MGKSSKLLFIFLTILTVISCSTDESLEDTNTPESKFTYYGEEFYTKNAYYTVYSDQYFADHTIIITDGDIDTSRSCGLSDTTENVIKLQFQTEKELEEGVYDLAYSSGGTNHAYVHTDKKANSCDDLGFFGVTKGTFKIEKTGDLYKITYTLYASLWQSEEGKMEGVFYGSLKEASEDTFKLN